MTDIVIVSLALQRQCMLSTVILRDTVAELPLRRSTSLESRFAPSILHTTPAHKMTGSALHVPCLCLPEANSPIRCLWNVLLTKHIFRRFRRSCFLCDKARASVLSLAASPFLDILWFSSTLVQVIENNLKTVLHAIQSASHTACNAGALLQVGYLDMHNVSESRSLRPST